MAENDPANMDWLPQDSAMPGIMERWRQQQARHVEKASQSRGLKTRYEEWGQAALSTTRSGPIASNA